MNADHITPPTPDRSPGRRPGLWFLVPSALAILLLALPAARVVRAETTVTIGHGETVTVEEEGVTITNNSGQPCQFTVHRSTVPPGGTPADPGEVPLQWDISSSDCSAPQVALTFHYSDEDLWYVANEGELSAFRYVGSSTWVDQCTGSCAYPSDNEVRVTEVTELGDWTIAEVSDGYPGPTAVTVRGPARAAGFDESGLVLGLSVLTGMGLILGWRLRNRSV